jgi:pimeloyl-ACP methyl ester carboxylesterase
MTPLAGRQRAWSVHGPPGAPLVVLIHGARLSRTLWVSVLPGLFEDHRVVTLDLPEHGALADVPFDLDDAADRVAAIIEEVANADGAAPSAVVVGHSLGGFVAGAVAARHPDRVAGLLICSATLDLRGPARLPTRLAALAYQLVPDRIGRRLDLVLLRARYGASVGDAVAEGGIWYRGAGRAVRDLVGRPLAVQLGAYGGPAVLANGIGVESSSGGLVTSCRSIGRASSRASSGASWWLLGRPTAEPSRVTFSCIGCRTPGAGPHAPFRGPP